MTKVKRITKEEQAFILEALQIRENQVYKLIELQVKPNQRGFLDLETLVDTETCFICQNVKRLYQSEFCENCPAKSRANYLCSRWCKQVGNAQYDHNLDKLLKWIDRARNKVQGMAIRE